MEAPHSPPVSGQRGETSEQLSFNSPRHDVHIEAPIEEPQEFVDDKRLGRCREAGNNKRNAWLVGLHGSSHFLASLPERTHRARYDPYPAEPEAGMGFGPPYTFHGA